MTIRELREEGRISTRAYNAILRNASNDMDRAFGYRGKFCRHYTTATEIIDLTVKDLFELIGEERMLRWRYFGPKHLEELKGLI